MAVHELKNFINGEYVEARGDGKLDIVNPADAQTYATSPVSNAADVDAAFKAADKAFEE